MLVDFCVRRSIALATAPLNAEAMPFGQGHNLEVEVFFKQLSSSEWERAAQTVDKVLKAIDHKNLVKDNPSEVPPQIAQLAPWIAQHTQGQSGLAVRKVCLSTGAGAGYCFGQDGEL